MPKYADEKFDDWCDGNSEKVELAITKTMEIYGRSRPECLGIIRDCRLWLISKRDIKAIQNRRSWNRFLLNFLKPKHWEANNGHTRKNVSTFDGTPRRG